MIDPHADWCELAHRWKIATRLARRLQVMAANLPFQISIISGYRTRAQQEQLAEEGRPTAPDDLSTHRECPATGADIWPAIAVTEEVKALVGVAAVRAQLRWGGGSRLNDLDLPIDWNHVDLGSRMKRS